MRGSHAVFAAKLLQRDATRSIFYAATLIGTRT